MLFCRVCDVTRGAYVALVFRVRHDDAIVLAVMQQEFTWHDAHAATLDVLALLLVFRTSLDVGRQDCQVLYTQRACSYVKLGKKQQICDSASHV